MYAIGILWNVSQRFARNIMLETAIKYPVIQVAMFDLQDRYTEFIQKLYAVEDMPDFRIKKKLEYMDFANTSKIIPFVIELNNPKYQFIERKKKNTCIQIEGYKKNIREKYSSKLPKYYFDTILHMSDDEEEFNYSVKLLEEFKDYCIEDYLRKGCNPIINWKKQNLKTNSTYSEILNKMEREI